MEILKLIDSITSNFFIRWALLILVIVLSITSIWYSIAYKINLDKVQELSTRAEKLEFSIKTQNTAIVEANNSLKRNQDRLAVANKEVVTITSQLEKTLNNQKKLTGACADMVNQVILSLQDEL